MTAVLIYIAVIVLICLVVATDPRADDVDAAMRRHPSGWSKATEEAIEQAVAIVDDGRALVRETEAYLRELTP